MKKMKKMKSHHKARHAVPYLRQLAGLPMLLAEILPVCKSEPKQLLSVMEKSGVDLKNVIDFFIDKIGYDQVKVTAG